MLVVHFVLGRLKKKNKDCCSLKSVRKREGLIFFSFCLQFICLGEVGWGNFSRWHLCYV